MTHTPAGRTRLFVLTMLLSACASSQSPSTPATRTTADAAILKNLDARVPAWLAEYSVPSVAISYISDGAVQWTRVYGEQSPGVPATHRTLYNVASLAKPVFAETVVRLAAAGKVDLDESLASHWVDPDVATDPRHRMLTPRLALSHRTGFPNWRPHNGSLAFKTEPGTVLGYSGEGYEYVRRFLERKLGVPLDAAVKENVLEPFGMTNTSLTEQAWFAERVALPNGPEGTYGKPETRTSALASDDLYTTSADYAAFVVGVVNRLNLPAAYARQRDSMHVGNLGATQSCDSTAVPHCPRIGMGLGWEILEFPDDVVRLHTGGDWGEAAMAFYFARRRAGAVILTNGANGMKVILGVVDVLFHDTDFAKLAVSKR